MSHSFLPLPLLLLPLLINSQSSHDESLRVILCSSLICDYPKECDIFEGIPQCILPPTPTTTTTSTLLSTLQWTSAFPTFPPFTFPTPPTPSPPPSASSSTIIPSTVPSICSLPPDTGPCTRARIMWYFDAETSSCQRFSFSGCGNGNRFSSRYQCELRCLADHDQDKPE